MLLLLNFFSCFLLQSISLAVTVGPRRPLNFVSVFNDYFQLLDCASDDKNFQVSYTQSLEDLPCFLTKHHVWTGFVKVLHRCSSFLWTEKVLLFFFYHLSLPRQPFTSSLLKSFSLVRRSPVTISCFLLSVSGIFTFNEKATWPL